MAPMTDRTSPATTRRTLQQRRDARRGDNAANPFAGLKINFGAAGERRGPARGAAFGGPHPR